MKQRYSGNFIADLMDAERESETEEEREARLDRIAFEADRRLDEDFERLRILRTNKR
jgi:hypothetical protein